jgi:pyruvate/2-oxoglutarate dehydrogenase complex dihydrolipoamide acyltransferase (E2) component
MPQLGESVAEGTIGRWLKQVGDHVDKYEPIVEVVTDKVNAEVPSPFAGTLSAILVQEGETVANNTEIAVIDGAGDEPAAVPRKRPSLICPFLRRGRRSRTRCRRARGGVSSHGTRRAGRHAPSPAATGGNGAASHGPAGSDERSAPVADYEGRSRQLCAVWRARHELDLSQVPGTGHAGRVTREDVLAYIERQRTGVAQPSPAPKPAAAPAAPGVPAGTAQPAPVAPPMAPPPAPAAADSLKPATQMRKAIAAQMTRALQVPHAYTTVEVDMSAVVRHRGSQQAGLPGREGIGLSYVAS